MGQRNTASEDIHLVVRYGILDNVICTDGARGTSRSSLQEPPQRERECVPHFWDYDFGRGTSRRLYRVDPQTASIGAADSLDSHGRTG